MYAITISPTAQELGVEAVRGLYLQAPLLFMVFALFAGAIYCLYQFIAKPLFVKFEDYILKPYSESLLTSLKVANETLQVLHSLKDEDVKVFHQDHAWKRDNITDVKKNTASILDSLKEIDRKIEQLAERQKECIIKQECRRG